MIFVHGGTFYLGKSEDSPGHLVTVSSFYLGQYELTQKEWIAVAGYNPSWFKGDSLPVEQIDWLDVFRFCNKISLDADLRPCYYINGQILPGELPLLSEEEIYNGRDTLSYSVTCNFRANGYRLPTETEWEFAAQGGIRTKNYLYSGSNDLATIAWFVENSNNQTHPVGLKTPNELGFYDLSGNVIERCWDWYAGYTNQYERDPKGPDYGTSRIMRGGSWSSGENTCLNTYRHHHPSYRDYTTGFRLCRKVE